MRSEKNKALYEKIIQEQEEKALKYKQTELCTTINNLKKQGFDFQPTKVPDGITLEILIDEMQPTPEEINGKKENQRKKLWEAYYIVCLNNKNKFGLYAYEKDLNNNNNKILVPWYKIKEDSVNENSNFINPPNFEHVNLEHTKTQRHTNTNTQTHRHKHTNTQTHKQIKSIEVK